MKRAGGDRHEMDEVFARLHQRGLRLTPVRRSLIALFASLGRWTTPQELYDEAEKAGLKPGLATVYRLVETLTVTGLCRAFPQPNRTIRYVFCPPGHHHRLICRGCGQVTNLEDCRIEAPDVPFQVEEHVVDFFGLCATCQTGAARQGDAAPESPTRTP